ncbi:MAG: T9SS type A sorting domain-containing protein [Chitinispirillaceae bacterium]|nr:T9SS type A sorting domain-containing protein [Chitinispirillaceae bacterium]
MKMYFNNVVFGLIAFVAISSTDAQTIAVADGYAEGTTGGGNASPKTVSSASDFKNAVGNNNAAVIIVSGRLNVGEVSIGSNKTIVGANASSGLYGGRIKVGGTNYIFQNLTIGPSSTDAMELSGATKAFIHKCEFWDGADGSLDIVRQSDYVTVSWCKFYYVNQTEHRNTILIGNGDDVTADEGKLHVTMHHNWFAEKCDQRMPRVRFGHVHIYNNYYNSTGSLYCIGTGVHCRIRVENSHFDDVNTPWQDYSGMANDGQIGWADLKFSNGASQPTYAPNKFPVFTPPYSFSMDKVEDVMGIVRAGAGNVFSNTKVTAFRGANTSTSDKYVIYSSSLSGNLSIVLNGSHSDIKRITLYSIAGKLVRMENVGERKNVENFSSVPKGFYFIRLESHQGNTIRKIVMH